MSSVSQAQAEAARDDGDGEIIDRNGGPLISTRKPEGKIMFGPWEVTPNQVFLTTPLTYALVNLKPLSVGHVLVCPLRPHRRLTDLSRDETIDLFSVVQVVQCMLARKYFPSPSFPPSASIASSEKKGLKIRAVTSPSQGSFNIAIQDGAGAGQTVPHVHVHIIPRIPQVSEKEGNGPTDEIYVKMANEDGNVGGALWDLARAKAIDGPRPTPGGMFESIEDATRKPRSPEAMGKEADEYIEVLRAMGY